MSRITQALAEDIAKALTKHLRQQYEESHQKFKDKVREYYMASIPSEVIDFQKHLPAFIATTSTVYFDGNGFSNEFENVNPSVPTKAGGGYTRISLSKEQGKVLQKMQNEYERQMDFWKFTKEETYNALLALRTYKNITDKFPEAAALLPPVAASTALIPNLEKLRQKISVPKS